MEEKDKNQPLVSIVIPVFNEEKNIGRVIDEIKGVNLSKYEILVVDDGSSDKTAEIAKKGGARVISHPYNIGNGAAVKTGIRSALGSVVVMMDGDGQHKPSDIPRLLSYIDRYNMVVGARSKSGQASFSRQVANKIYNVFASFIAQFPIADLTSGFRAVRKRDALRFCDILPNTFSYPATITLAFIRSGRAVKYLPIETGKRKGSSKIKPSRDGFEFLVIITRIGMSFAPFRVFLPVSAFLFFLGLARYAYTYTMFHRFTNMSHLLVNSAVIVFMLGLVAEQIASLRMEKGEIIEADIKDQEKYDLIANEAGKLSS